MTVLGEQCRLAVLSALQQYQLPASNAAVNLLCMVAAHESGGFRYNLQLHGPAISMFQMEPATYAGLCRYIQERSDSMGLLDSHFPPERMVFDFSYAAAMARVFFLRKPEPLPKADDIDALAEYAKFHWNTFLGEATPALYARAYQRFFCEN